MTISRLSRPAEQLPQSPQEWCERGNASIAAIPRDDIEWIVMNGRPVLRWKKSSLAMLRETAARKRDAMDRRGQPMSESDTFALNKKLEELGANARYHADGTRYLVNEC